MIVPITNRTALNMKNHKRKLTASDVQSNVHKSISEAAKEVYDNTDAMLVLIVVTNADKTLSVCVSPGNDGENELFITGAINGIQEAIYKLNRRMHN